MVGVMFDFSYSKGYYYGLNTKRVKVKLVFFKKSFHRKWVYIYQNKEDTLLMNSEFFNAYINIG